MTFEKKNIIAILVFISVQFYPGKATNVAIDSNYKLTVLNYFLLKFNFDSNQNKTTVNFIMFLNLGDKCKPHSLSLLAHVWFFQRRRCEEGGPAAPAEAGLSCVELSQAGADMKQVCLQNAHHDPC